MKLKLGIGAAGGSRAGPFKKRGFTLIEVMVVVAILGILSAIALPSYRSYLAKAKRADARTQLLLAAQFMQRFYAANDQYKFDRAGNNITTEMPANLQQSPADSTAVYTLTITPTTTTFLLTMTPVAGGVMAADGCGNYTLTNTGVKGVTGTLSRDECWR